MLPASAVRNEGENSDYVPDPAQLCGVGLDLLRARRGHTSVRVLEREKLVSIEDDLATSRWLTRKTAS